MPHPSPLLAHLTSLPPSLPLPSSASCQKSVGYRTMAIGKWHLGQQWEVRLPAFRQQLALPAHPRCSLIISRDDYPTCPGFAYMQEKNKSAYKALGSMPRVPELTRQKESFCL
jgi:arylsulfatase A-like enzyme